MVRELLEELLQGAGKPTGIHFFEGFEYEALYKSYRNPTKWWVLVCSGKDNATFLRPSTVCRLLCGSMLLRIRSSFHLGSMGYSVKVPAGARFLT